MEDIFARMPPEIMETVSLETIERRRKEL